MDEIHTDQRKLTWTIAESSISSPRMSTPLMRRSPEFSLVFSEVCTALLFAHRRYHITDVLKAGAQILAILIVMGISIPTALVAVVPLAVVYHRIMLYVVEPPTPLPAQ